MSPLPPQLEAMVNAIHPLPEAVWIALRPLLTRRSLARGALFATLGETQRTIGLLERGIVRAYYTTADGNEYNKHFFVAPALIGDYASLLTRRPVELPQQALTEGVVWTLDHEALLGLEPRFVDLVQIQRRFAENLYLENERRELQIATMSASQRYEELTARYPRLETEIALYHIAAYLGITPTQLSRIRSRKRTRRVST
ncbi:MAG: cyclic nucleotide-binding domain-containing protein [Deltaproteobacteria bacterium]|nr:cyclic nucleotide-binding domain-containing protein [Deltaproteobacteria bacterium]